MRTIEHYLSLIGELSELDPLNIDDCPDFVPYGVA